VERAIEAVPAVADVAKIAVVKDDPAEVPQRPALLIHPVTGHAGGVEEGGETLSVTTPKWSWFTMFVTVGILFILLLVAIIGPGVMARIIAIGLRSIGFIAKLLYEAIEEIDHNQVEAVAATGASRAQVMDYAIVPQILPAFAGITVFRWDINIRESAILGLVGAGGIGLQLQASLNVLAWPQVTLIFIVILATVAVSEWVSAKVRQAII